MGAENALGLARELFDALSAEAWPRAADLFEPEHVANWFQDQTPQYTAGAAVRHHGRTAASVRSLRGIRSSNGRTAASEMVSGAEPLPGSLPFGTCRRSCAAARLPRRTTLRWLNTSEIEDPDPCM